MLDVEPYKLRPHWHYWFISGSLIPKLAHIICKYNVIELLSQYNQLRLAAQYSLNTPLIMIHQSYLVIKLCQINHGGNRALKEDNRALKGDTRALTEGSIYSTHKGQGNRALTKGRAWSTRKGQGNRAFTRGRAIEHSRGAGQ